MERFVPSPTAFDTLISHDMFFARVWPRLQSLLLMDLLFWTGLIPPILSFVLTLESETNALGAFLIGNSRGLVLSDVVGLRSATSVLGVAISDIIPVPPFSLPNVTQTVYWSGSKAGEVQGLVQTLDTYFALAILAYQS